VISSLSLTFLCIADGLKGLGAALNLNTPLADALFFMVEVFLGFLRGPAFCRNS
jgi:hypothetical protein